MGIINKDGSLYMATGIDNTGLYSGFNQAEKRIDDFEAYIKKAGNNITRLTGIGFGVAGLKAFGSEIINVYGEMQMLQSSFEVLLGGKGVSGFTTELKKFAVDSPLSLTGVSQAAQTLLGFGIAADKVMPTIKQMGDISMGNEEKFKSLSLAFAQMSATGKLMGQDLLQMINAGFNPLMTISEKTGKSIGDLKKDMEAGSISSDMVADAFRSATAEGGKFYGMTQKQAEGIRGLQAQLEGGLQDAYNKIGQSQESFIAGGYKLVISLVENYETIGKAILGLITTYGAYKAAVVFATQAEAGWNAVQLITYNRLLLVEKAQKLLNATMLANPYVLLATVTIGLVATIWAMHDATTAQEKAQKRLNEINEEATQKKQDLQNETQQLITTINSETASLLQQIVAYEKLQNLYPKWLRNMSRAEFQSMSLKEQQILLNKAMDEIDMTSANEELKKQQKIIDELNNKIKTLTSNLANTDGPNNGGQTSARLQSLKDQLHVEEKTLENLKSQNKEREEAKRQEEFEALPQEEKNKILKEQLTSLKEQEGLIRNQISGIKGINGEWIKLNPTFIGLNNQLSVVLSKIKEITGKLNSDKGDTKNKSFWEKEKKDAETALDEMDKAEKGSKKWNEQLKKRNEAEANLKTWDFSGRTNKQLESAAEKAHKQAQEIVDQNEKIKQLEDKQSLDRRRQYEDLANQEALARINAMQFGAEKIRAQREYNNKLEIQSIERQKEDYIRSIIQAEKEKFDAQEELELKKNPKYTKKIFNASSVKVDASKYDSILGFNIASDINAEIDASNKAWNEYFVQFGTYQEKRKAIIDKYNREIAEAIQDGEKAILEKNKQNALDELDNSVKNSATLLGQLFADASRKSVNEIQAIIDKADLLMQYLEAVKDEQGNTNINGKAVSRNDILNLGISDNTLKNLELSAQEVEALRNAINKLKGDLGSKSPFKLFEGQIGDAINKIKQGGKKNIAQGITEIGSATAQFAPQVAEFGKNIGNIAGNDELGSKIEGVANAIGGVGEAAQGVGQIMSGDVVGGVMSVVSGVSKAVDALDGLFGADYSRYNKMVQEYDKLNEVWDQLIEKKKEYIDIDYGDEARKAAKEAISLLEKQAASNITLGKERLNSGASAGSHSIGIRQRKNMSSEGWSQLANWAKNENISSALYGSIKDGRMTGLFDLTAEQLENLKEQAPTFWAKLDADVQKYLNNIIDSNDEIEKMKESLKETLNGVSFDSFYDNWVDMLSDLDSDNQDFAKNFGEYLKKSILANIVAQKYRSKIQDLYNQWASYSDSNGDGNYDLTAEESNRLREAQQALADQMLAERDSLADAFGWAKDSSFSQSSSRGSYETITQDQAGAIDGRLTGIHEVDLLIQQNTFQLVLLSTESNQLIRGYKEEFMAIRNVLVESRFLWEEIRDSNNELYEIKDILQEIKKNTKGLITK